MEMFGQIKASILGSECVELNVSCFYLRETSVCYRSSPKNANKGLLCNDHVRFLAVFLSSCTFQVEHKFNLLSCGM